MYRYSQTLPGGPITLVGILALSFLIPGWVANALGFSAVNAQLVDWIFQAPGHFLHCPAACSTASSASPCWSAPAWRSMSRTSSLIRALVAVRNWAVRTSVAIAQLLGRPAVLAAARSSSNCCGINIESGTAKLIACWQERHELRRALPRRTTRDFPSYRAFLRHWRALQAAEQAKTDPLQQAIRLMGLTEPFTRDDLKERFHILIAGIHPDLVGPNELATQLIAANTLICERKRWK